MTISKFIFKNNSEILNQFNTGLEDAIEIVAKDAFEAGQILQGMDGGNSFNEIRDEGLGRGADEIIPATDEEIAEYLQD
ncbi:hypothetical protein [Kiloniella antarctica]|uniref:Uncharacterized protein n=1 Tax=Kiloniella antarctica TaxID=1550907 RepID=A0ABW5BP47_9PROT